MFFCSPNANLLASAEELQSEINQKGSKELIILDTRSEEAYAARHIPGAVNVAWGDFTRWNNPPEKAVLKSVPDLEDPLGALGLTRTSRIVIYDDTLHS